MSNPPFKPSIRPLRRGAAAAAALALLLGAAGPAVAQTPPPPRPPATRQPQQPPAAAAQPQTFGSWVRACERSGRTEICSLRQLVAPKENPKQPIMAVAIGRLTPDRKMAMVIKLPTQINREAGIGFRIDGGEVMAIPVQGCDAGSCTVAITLDDTLLKQLRAGNEALVAFRGQQGQVAPMPVSLAGLTRGLASLK